jgi:tetratricopeptide (TPR) repeat protein
VGVAFEALVWDIVGGTFGDIGHVLERRDRPHEALLLFEKAVEATPNDALSWYNLGDTLLALGRYDDARKALERSISLGGDGWLVHYDLGLALYHLGEFEKASQSFRQLLGRDAEMKRAPADPIVSVLTNLALCYGALSRWKEAISTLSPALKGVPNILYNLGRFHRRDGNHVEAQRLLAMAAELEPRSEDILHEAGAVLMSAGKWVAAEGYLSRATKLRPPCPYAWYDLGVTYAKQGKARLRKAARRCFERVLRLEPEHAWAHYNLACLDALERKRDASFRRLRRAIDLGLRDRQHVVRDPDLKSLRRDPRWKEIVARLPAK